MIAVGIILILAGAGCLLYGNSQNNDMNVVMGTFLNSGKTNPGDTFVTIGIIGIIIGAIVLILGIIKYIKTSGSGVESGEKKYIVKDVSDSDILTKGGWKCSCGKVNYNYVTSCSSCRKTREQAENEIYQREQEEKVQREKKQETELLDLLYEYKRLLDEGVISPEIYENKKRIIMNGDAFYDHECKELERIKKIEKYMEMLKNGVITQDEFEDYRQKILADVMSGDNSVQQKSKFERYRICPKCGKKNLKSLMKCSQCNSELTK